MKLKLSTQIIGAFSLVIALSIIDSYTNYLLSLKVKANSEFLSKSESVIRNSNRLHKSMIEMQGAFRGFLLTEDTTFLELYNLGMVEVPFLHAEQEVLIRENQKQVAMLDSIYILHSRWLEYSNEMIASKKSVLNKSTAGLEYQALFETKLKKQIGKNLNDDIKILFNDFDKSEYAFRNSHSQSLNQSIYNTHLRSVIFLILTFIIGVGSVIYIVRLISSRIAKMVNLAKDIAKGEFRKVDDTRNDELTSLSSSLNIMSDNLGKTMIDLQNRNAELNKFAHVVSHDLKAPVRGIRNVVKWLEEDFDPFITKEMKEYLDIIPQRTQRMEDLINGLLNYATISDKTKIEEVDTHKLVKEITQYLAPRDCSIVLKDLPVMYTECLKLEQVFTNLLSNAINAIVNQQGQIMVSCVEYDNMYEFSVKDNGIGIAEEFHERVFEIFQTLRKGNERESTGIGLAIVKKIIEEQGGKIYVVSSVGAGAEFIFTWPKLT